MNFLLKVPFIRGLAWRLSRKVYMWARRETDFIRQENGEYWLLKTLIKTTQDSKPIFLDVGGHEGFWSEEACQLLSQAQKDGVIYTFEPTASTFEYLQNRLKKYKNIHPIRKALSNSVGERDLFVVCELAGINSLVEIKNSTREKVATITVDQFFKNESIDKVVFIKSDTEGHDFSIIQGAIEALSAGKIEAWQFEYNHRWVEQGSTLKTVFEFLKDKPYELGKLYSNGIEIYQKWHMELERFFECNYVLVKKGSVLLEKCDYMEFNRCNVPVKTK